MAERLSDDNDAQKTKPKRAGRAILLASVLFVAGAGGGYFGLKKAIRPLFAEGGHQEPHAPASSEIAFIPLEPILINLGASGSGHYLRFKAQIEVAAKSEAEITALIPRLMDVLNSYLRAVEPSMLEDRAALVRLKAQMLRRVQMVAGPEKVRDLLVVEFLVS